MTTDRSPRGERSWLAVFFDGTTRARLDQPAGLLAAALVVLIPLALLLAPTSWSSNEDAYFTLAYRTFAPDRFHDLSAAFDASRGRFLYQYLTGWMVRCWVTRAPT